MTSRPDKFPRWATNDVVDTTTGQNNVIEPPEARKDNGWAYQEKPPRNWVNWLWRTTHAWLEHLDVRTNALAAVPSVPANMVVSVKGGFLDLIGGIRKTIAATNITITAPATDSKNVLLVLDMVTAAIVSIDGVSAASPVDPVVGSGQRRLARVRVTAGQTIITSASIDDLRSYISDPRFIGEMMDYGSATPPPGWLLCDGAAVSRTTYANLFSVIGTTWGTGDGSTTFNLPARSGRMAIGIGTGTGLTARTIAQTGGAETHVLTQAQTPVKSHSHPITDVAHSHTIYANTGGGGAVNNIDSSEPRGVDNFSKVTASSLTGITGTGAAGDTAATAHPIMAPWIAVPVFIRAL